MGELLSCIAQLHKTYLDLVPEDLRRGPVNLRRVGVHAVDHESTAAADVVDAVLRELLDTGGLDNHVEPVRVVLLQLLPLRPRVLPVELDVLVRGVQLLGDVHLDALVGRDGNAVRAVQLKQLSEDQAGRTGAEEQHVDTDWRVELIETVDGACRGLEKRGLLIGKVVDLVALALVVDDVLREAAVLGDAACVEVLAKNGLAAPAVEAGVALRTTGSS